MTEAKYKDAGILVVDVDCDAVDPLVDALQRAGYGRVRTCTDRAGITDSLAEGVPDLVVIDLGAAEVDGLTLLAEWQKGHPDEFLPVIALGPARDPRLAVTALRAGARDYLGRPLDPEDLLVRVKGLLATRALCLRLRDGRRAVEEDLRKRTRECQESHTELLDLLGRVAELRDDPSGGHPGRVGRLAALIAQELALPAEETRCLLQAAPLHDLGHVAIPDSIVRHVGKFTDEQREQMRQHASLGAHLLHGAQNVVLQMAEVIALSHHERWDGLGYPQGLTDENIPMPARIVAVADAFDTMTHPGMYKEPYPIPMALDELRREAGWQFDPDVVSALVRVYHHQPAMLSVTPQSLRRSTC